MKTSSQLLDPCDALVLSLIAGNIWKLVCPEIPRVGHFEVIK